MKIKVKKLHPDAILPKSAHVTDAGYDLVAIDDGKITDTYIQYRTGLSIEVESGYHTELFPRSSISEKDLVLANSVGVVDHGYRNELFVRFKIIPPLERSETTNMCRLMFVTKKYKKGDKIAQLLVRRTEHADFEWAEELSDTERNQGGFGSSGQ